MGVRVLFYHWVGKAGMGSPKMYFAVNSLQVRDVSCKRFNNYVEAPGFDWLKHLMLIDSSYTQVARDDLYPPRVPHSYSKPEVVRVLTNTFKRSRDSSLPKRLNEIYDHNDIVNLFDKSDKLLFNSALRLHHRLHHSLPDDQRHTHTISLRPREHDFSLPQLKYINFHRAQS